MAKDDVDAFVVDMKMLASILGHNDDLIMEKFKDIFPDPNIEAALIAMDNFAAMQTKAKQLVQIYKPTHSTNAASAALLVHTPTDSPNKDKSSQPKSNQHQLAPIDPPQEQQNRSGGNFNSGKRGRGRGNDRSNRGHGVMETQIIDMKIKIEGEVEVKVEGSITKIEEEVKKTFQEADVGHGKIMIPITVIGITGIDPMKAKTIAIEVGDGTETGDKTMVTEAELDDGTNTINIPHKSIRKNYPPSNHYRPPPMGRQYQYQMPYEQYPPYPQQQQYAQRPPAQSRQAVNICQLCQNQGHYDYQCQFAGDFMARTQKAFNQGRSYNHQDPTQGEWSTGENDNEDPKGQPFQ